MSTETHWPSVVVPTPAHSALGDCLTYASPEALAPGTLVRVPLGKRDLLGVVWDCPTQPPPGLMPEQTRAVSSVLAGIAPLNAEWRELVQFAAQYYQRALGEVALAALPPQLRDLQPDQWQRRLKKADKAEKAAPPVQAPTTDATGSPAPDLSPEQAAALAALATATQPVLLFGATGSGKTEVYLHAAQTVLAADPLTQVLVLVPEINLTPQLQQRFTERFAPVYGASAVVALHSGMTPAQRLTSWLAAHTGAARIVLGTRMAVLASLPHLRLIVVDEEHDPSYKSQDGARHSARDLAIYRAHLLTRHGSPCQVVLGSATPSLESWHAAATGRYLRQDMASRVGGGALPRLRLLDMAQQPKGAVLAPALVGALIERAQRGEQALLLLNRRGYAPVLACHACGWKSQCPSCSAFRVFHKIDRTLRCHHCGFTERVPRACPECGNLDIAPVGKGTEQLEEQVTALLSGQQRPDGQPLRVARMDADSTRTKGSLEAQLARMHSGEVDVLVGTQMVAKGHDFRRITLVAALNADAALFASDYRAPERMFSLLMQAGGRAGRDAALSSGAELWVQTWHPTHPLFAALKKHDFPAFAAQQLEDRQAAQLPPFVYQALLRAEARTQEAAQAFLAAAREAARGLDGAEHLTLFPPVPMAIQRVANVERAQMLLESPSRPALQHVLTHWHTALATCRALPGAKGLIRWAIDVDPLAI
jgi:primosomal protein N' (replication factor Y) (superfamily II helicase)